MAATSEENPPTRREATVRTGRKRRRPPVPICLAGAIVAVAFHLPRTATDAAVVGGPIDQPAAYQSTWAQPTPPSPSHTPSSDVTSAALAPPLSSSLSLAALASPWTFEEHHGDDTSRNDDEVEGSESSSTNAYTNIKEEDEDGDFDINAWGTGDDVPAPTKGSSISNTEGDRVDEEEFIGDEGPPPPTLAAEPLLLHLGDFEKEVRMRVSDYRTELRDTMRSVRDRLVAARSQGLPQQLGQQARSTDKAGSDSQQEQRIDGTVGETRQDQVDSLRHKDEESSRPTAVIDVVSVNKISRRRLSRVERQLSKKRKRLLRTLSSLQDDAVTSSTGRSSNEMAWGELVAPRHSAHSVTATEPSTAKVNAFGVAPSFTRTTLSRRKKVRVSASGHLHRVHRDLKGGGNEELASPTPPTQQSSFYVPHIAQVASRRLYDAALRVTDSQSSLRTQVRVLVTALLYVAAASIMIRMLMWALFVRR